MSSKLKFIYYGNYVFIISCLIIFNFKIYSQIEVKNAISPKINKSLENDQVWLRKLSFVTSAIKYGLPEVAIIHITKMLKSYANYEDRIKICNRYLIESLIRSKEYDKAIKLYEDKYIDKNNYLVKYWYGVALNKVGKFSNSIKIFKEIKPFFKNEPKLVDYYRSIAIHVAEYQRNTSQDNKNFGEGINIIKDLLNFQSSLNNDVKKIAKNEDKKMTLTQLYLARLLIQNNDFRLGKDRLEKILTQSFELETIRLILLAQALDALDETQKSINIYKELLVSLSKNTKFYVQSDKPSLSNIHFFFTKFNNY